MDELTKLFCVVTNEEGIQRQYYFKGVSTSSIEKSSVMTEYATQEGTKFSDHKYRELQTVTITLNINQLVQTGAYYLQNEVYTYLSIDEIKKLILHWFVDNIFVDIKTRQEDFYNYQLTGYSWDDTSENLGYWSPVITFKEARVSSLQDMQYIYPETTQDSAANSERTQGGPNNGNDETASTNIWNDYVVKFGTWGFVGGTLFGMPWLGTLAGGAVGLIAGAGTSFGWW